MPFTVRENLIFHRKDGRIRGKKIFAGKYGFRFMKTGMAKFVNAGRMIECGFTEWQDMYIIWVNKIKLQACTRCDIIVE